MQIVQTMYKSMKKILVPLQIFKDNPKFPTDAMEQIYTRKLMKYDLLPIFVSSVMTQEAIDELYELSNGLYLAGGEDWDPALYNQKKHEKTEIKEAERDKLELPLIKRALNDKKPILAICRGAEGLAIADGGSLVQHIPDKFPEEVHMDPKISYYDLPLAPKHPVKIIKSSKVYKLLEKDKIMVNSYHHQSIDNPGAHMRVVGKSPAGVVEIIEHEDSKYFCIGIQSHPEMEENSFVEPIFEAFANVIKKGSFTALARTRKYPTSLRLSKMVEYQVNSEGK